GRGAARGQRTLPERAVRAPERPDRSLSEPSAVVGRAHDAQEREGYVVPAHELGRVPPSLARVAGRGRPPHPGSVAPPPAPRPADRSPAPLPEADGPPVVTVVIPVYDRLDVLRQSIESILRQTFRQFELLLVCDGSPLSTMAVVYDYRADPRVRVIRYLDNSG